MAQKKFSELEAGSVDGTSIFAQTKTEDGSLVSKSASSTSLAGYIGTSHQFAGLSTTAKNLVGAINEAAQSGGGASVIQLTQAEYTALSTAEKMNGSIYKITDNAKMYCLDEEYHPVKELTTAQYNALTTAEQNDGTIYIKTDAETTGEDISVSSTDARTIDEGIADANGQIIDYATWQTMTPQEQAAAGKVYVPDFPTATPNATEIPMSSSDNTSVAAAVSNSMFSIVHNYNTFTFRVSEWRYGQFFSFLLYGGTGISKPFFYICFISDTGVVSLTPVVPLEGATISGTADRTTKTVTITSDKTIYGGINVIICRRTEN
jgi:hypothetical protein